MTLQEAIEQAKEQARKAEYDVCVFRMHDGSYAVAGAEYTGGVKVRQFKGRHRYN